MRLRRVLAVAAACLAALACGTARAQPPIWIVRTSHGSMVLFGSLHVLPHNVDWAPKVLTDGLAKADEVWFELPIDASTRAKLDDLVRARGLFAASDHLTAHLDEAQAARLRRDAPSLGVTLPMLEPLRPWLADVVLSLALDAKSGATGANGVETRVRALAPPTAALNAFETPDEQIDILAGAPMDEQVATLVSTLDDIEDKDAIFERLLQSWMNCDLTGLEREALEPIKTKTPELYARLITARNRRWVTAITERLHHDGAIVVVVGVGHLIGPDGVPAQLRKAGFAVEGP